MNTALYLPTIDIMKLALDYNGTYQQYNSEMIMEDNTVCSLSDIASIVKEKAFDMGYSIFSGKRVDGFSRVFYEAEVSKYTFLDKEKNIEHNYQTIKYSEGQKESEAIFKAMEFILNLVKENKK